MHVYKCTCLKCVFSKNILHLHPSLSSSWDDFFNNYISMVEGCVHHSQPYEEAKLVIQVLKYLKAFSPPPPALTLGLDMLSYSRCSVQL